MKPLQDQGSVFGRRVFVAPSGFGGGNPRVIPGRFLSLALLLLAAGTPVRAQELEPRAYLTLPTGLNILTCSYAYSHGGVLTDPNLPIDDARANVHTAFLGYMRSFSAAGRSASVSVLVPCAVGRVEGLVYGEFVSTRRNGPGDPRIRLAVNILGGPALSPKEFRNYRQKTNLGASLTVVAPLGQYDPSRLVNLGGNRWTFKPEVGLSHLQGKWLLDAYAGIWFFTDNPDFFGGKVREQHPVLNLQGHVGYEFRKNWQATLNVNFYMGGQTVVDGVSKLDLQRNSRIGGTLFVPLARSHSLKVSVSSGAYTRIGSNFTTLSVTWLYRWF